jgi:hypothetical protein
VKGPADSKIKLSEILFLFLFLPSLFAISDISFLPKETVHAVYIYDRPAWPVNFSAPSLERTATMASQAANQASQAPGAAPFEEDLAATLQGIVAANQENEVKSTVIVSAHLY